MQSLNWNDLTFHEIYKFKFMQLFDAAETWHKVKVTATDLNGQNLSSIILQRLAFIYEVQQNGNNIFTTTGGSQCLTPHGHYIVIFLMQAEK